MSSPASAAGNNKSRKAEQKARQKDAGFSPSTPKTDSLIKALAGSNTKSDGSGNDIIDTVLRRDDNGNEYYEAE